MTGTEERLATGDAVNVAARLEQAAQPGEILIGETTLALVRDAVEAEPVEPLELKGKAEPVPAYRLLAVDGGARARGTRRRFVGRETRARALRRRLASRRSTTARCQLVTVARGRPGSASRGWRPSSSPGSTHAIVARPLPLLRRGDHLLAGGRGARSSSTRFPRIRPRRPRSARCSARREQGTSAEEIAWALPQAARGAASAARLRVRRHPLGRGDLPRPGRARRAALAPARRSCFCAWRARAARAPAWQWAGRPRPARAALAEETDGRRR